MFETIKKLFKEEEKEEKEEPAIEKNDYEKHFKQEVPEYITLQFYNNPNSRENELHVYLKGDYLGYILIDRVKVEALDSDEEKRILDMISKMVKDREEELEQQRLRKEIAKEKLEFLRLRNEMLKKKLNERNDKAQTTLTNEKED